MHRLIAVALVLSSACAFAAEGYKVVRPDGTVEFTDQPTKGAQTIDIPDPQTYTPPPAPVLTEPVPAPPPRAAVAPTYKRVAVVSPANDSSVVSNDGMLQVAVLVDPPLQPGHKVVLLLDGKRVAVGGGVFMLEQIERGTHTLTAKVVDETDKTLLSSPDSTIHIQHHFIRKNPLPRNPIAR